MNREIISSLGCNNKTVIFRLNIRKPTVETLLFIIYTHYMGFPEEANGIVEETQSAYFPLLVEYAKRWAKEGNSEVILSNSLELNGSGDEIKRSFDGRDWAMPYLHVQEVDVNPCQFMTMLGNTASQYSSLAVNEFTWSAFARHENEMTSEKCPNALSLPANPPPTFLIFSSGLCDICNKTEQYYKKLLQNHQTISGWQLSTLVFPSKDVKHSTCADKKPKRYQHDDRKYPTNQGIMRFALEMKNNYSIGCLVEFGDELYGYGSTGPSKLEKTKTWCNQLMDISTVIIWRFSLDFSSDINLELNFGYRKFKQNLLRILLQRESFHKEFPDKEVILQITIPNADSFAHHDGSQYQSQYGLQVNVTCANEMGKDLHEFYKGIQTWAGIHGVKVILSPAYHPEEPAAGLWMLPDDDGTPNKIQIGECSYEATHWKIHY